MFATNRIQAAATAPKGPSAWTDAIRGLVSGALLRDLLTDSEAIVRRAAVDLVGALEWARPSLVDEIAYDDAAVAASTLTGWNSHGRGGNLAGLAVRPALAPPAERTCPSCGWIPTATCGGAPPSRPCSSFARSTAAHNLRAEFGPRWMSPFLAWRARYENDEAQFDQDVLGH